MILCTRLVFSNFAIGIKKAHRTHKEGIKLTIICDACHGEKMVTPDKIKRSTGASVSRKRCANPSTRLPSSLSKALPQRRSKYGEHNSFIL